MQLSVIDVSTWQGNIDFDKVKSSGIQAVIIRCGFTGYATSLPVKADNMFEKNYQSAVASGLDIGVYYYSCATTEAKALEEAQFTLNQIKGKKITYPVYFDTEDNHNTTASGVNPQNQITIGKTKLTSIANVFCSTINNAGYTAGIYGSTSWLETHIDMTQLTQYECWVAQYFSVNQYKGTCQMWQYSSTGNVAGISGHVDMNYCYKDYSSPAVPDTPGLVQYPMQRNGLTAAFDYITFNGVRRFHYGIDISNTQNQTFDVYAANSGSVVQSSSNTDEGQYIALSGYYNDSVDIVTFYGQLSSRVVFAGQTVTRGQKIGVQGASGVGTGQHLQFETWLVPKNYTFNEGDRETYAVDPVSVCHIMPGQLFPFVDSYSHNFEALTYPPTVPDGLAPLSGSILKLTGAGVGMYAEPLEKCSPIIGGFERTRATLLKFCGNMQYAALKSGIVNGKTWVLTQTCYGQLWTPIVAGSSELATGSVTNPTPTPTPIPIPTPSPLSCEKQLAQAQLKLKAIDKALGDMATIIAKLAK